MGLQEDTVRECFMTCVNDLTTKTLSTPEKNCSTKCAEKFMGFLDRAQFKMKVHQIKERAQMELDNQS
ncbi:hypothetical protein HDV02_001431 [Globomyces sp. JEL0801]|nr:hypothetical protein HDV02_001431 [Globomyces sp. JEL0801]